MGARFFHCHGLEVATVLLCLAGTGQAADAVDRDDDLVDGRVMVGGNELRGQRLRWAPRQGSPQVGTSGAVLLEAEANLTTSLRLGLAVSESERRSESWSRVDLAHETTSRDIEARETLEISLAAFQEERPDAAAQEADRRNRVGLFLGATTKNSHTHATIGLEYERRLSELIGIGAVAEGSPAGREFVGAVPVFFHPVGGLALSIGPGFSVDEGHTHFLVRFGVGWDFELPAGLSLAPTLSYDLTEGADDAIVYGLMLSYAF